MAKHFGHNSLSFFFYESSRLRHRGGMGGKGGGQPSLLLPDFYSCLGISVDLYEVEFRFGFVG